MVNLKIEIDVEVPNNKIYSYINCNYNNEEVSDMTFEEMIELWALSKYNEGLGCDVKILSVSNE